MKKILATVLALSLLTPAVAFADNDDHIEREIRTDVNYQANVKKATQLLQSKGYQVVGIDPDVHRGQKTLGVEAYKNGQEYDIRLSYPNLEILSERLDD